MPYSHQAAAQQPYTTKAVSVEDYARAERYLAPAAAGLTTGGTVAATWLPDERFWHRNATANSVFSISTAFMRQSVLRMWMYLRHRLSGLVAAELMLSPTGADSKNRIVCAPRPAHHPRMHKTIEPTILYFGTPVALISTVNEDGTPNTASMSSAWWLGWTCMLGLGTMGKTSENLIRTRECVINLPSEDLVSHVDRLAMTTGKNPVPERKAGWGYRYEPDKFGTAGFTTQPSVSIAAPRIAECPVQMEGVVHQVHAFGKNVSANAFEVHITKLHVDESLIAKNGPRQHIDADAWRPLFMSFCRFYGIGGELIPSQLAQSEFMAAVGVARQPTVAETHEGGRDGILMETATSSS